MDTRVPFLTIGIPTYNRGKRALELVQSLVSDRDKIELSTCVEIFVSNNGSTIGAEKYDEIKAMAEMTSNLTYFRFPTNMQFVGNMINVLKRAQAEWCLIISDEDTINFENIKLYLNYLLNHSEISVMKARTSGEYNHIESIYAGAGQDAIEAFFLKGNYVSGVIYNRKVLTPQIIESIHCKYCKDNVAYFYYPHLFWDTYCLLNGAFASSDILLVVEGEPVEGAEPENGIYVYGYPEERIAQGVGFADYLRELNLSDELAVLMFLMIYNKTKFLLNVNRNEYINNLNLDYDEIIKKTKETFVDRIYSMGFEAPDMYEPVIRQFIMSD